MKIEETYLIMTDGVNILGCTPESYPNLIDINRDNQVFPYIDVEDVYKLECGCTECLKSLGARKFDIINRFDFCVMDLSLNGFLDGINAIKKYIKLQKKEAKRLLKEKPWKKEIL